MRLVKFKIKKGKSRGKILIPLRKRKIEEEEKKEEKPLIDRYNACIHDICNYGDCGQALHKTEFGKFIKLKDLEKLFDEFLSSCNCKERNIIEAHFKDFRSKILGDQK